MDMIYKTARIIEELAICNNAVAVIPIIINGLVLDRDVIGAINIGLKHLSPDGSFIH